MSKNMRKPNIPDFWKVRNKNNTKYTPEEKEILNKLMVNGMSYSEIERMSENIMKKIYAHGDTSKSSQEFTDSHPELKNKSWKEKRKALKKRFPYLTYKEIDYLHEISKTQE